ncbi:Spy/CpxP family protein refolding chaperone [Pedobacter frigiditerrae]|uniref:Spy/CpxP family protein refolding chaperone n=1 Tax=Pedobacter frigiditerrae TaxID=2530452 RepID=UPI00292F21A9|nr:Spy/CpxP family protein refolding chaperone [Pedobacter frigiditerrae]
MKKLVLSLVLVAGLAFAANAQQGGGGQRRPQMTPEERVKQLDEKVKLTDEQKTKVTAVYAEAAEAQKKMREEMMAGGGTPDRAAMMEKMTKMTADTDTKLNAIFTAEQKTAYKTWQDEMKAAREKAMKERQAGGGGK